MENQILNEFAYLTMAEGNQIADDVAKVCSDSPYRLAGYIRGLQIVEKRREHAA